MEEKIHNKLKLGLGFGVVALTVGLLLGAANINGDLPRLGAPVMAQDNNVLNCGNGYITNLDWNISVENMQTNNSSIIDHIDTTGSYSNSNGYKQFGTKKSPGASITYTLTHYIDAIGFYALGTTASGPISVNGNSTGKTPVRQDLNEYDINSDEQRYFIEFDEPQYEITISTDTVFYLCSVGWYSQHNFPDYEAPEQPVDPGPTPELGDPVIVTFTPGTDTGATSVKKDSVTVEMTTMNNASYYQIYANQSGTFTAPTGKVITNIQFTCTASGTSKYGPGNASANVGTYSYSGNQGTWSGSANTVTISTTVQIRMTSLTITYQ